MCQSLFFNKVAGLYVFINHILSLMLYCISPENVSDYMFSGGIEMQCGLEWVKFYGQKSWTSILVNKIFSRNVL